MISGIILNWKILSSQISCNWGPRRREQGKIYEEIIAEKFSDEMIILNKDPRLYKPQAKKHKENYLMSHYNKIEEYH